MCILSIHAKRLVPYRAVTQPEVLPHARNTSVELQDLQKAQHVTWRGEFINTTTAFQWVCLCD
jgi:hypothetical protein